MSHAHMVIGLAYGDEGKGGWVDHLVRHHRIRNVVRFNGGAQAGHQVVTKDGRDHIFSQFGSGMFVPGTETLLSRFMLVEPEALIKEASILETKGVETPLDRLIVSENAPVITPMNRVLNRILEVSRGAHRHGSCGFGIGLTQGDVEALGESALYMKDLRDDGGREKFKALYQLKSDFLATIDCSSCHELVQQFEAIDSAWYSDFYLRFFHRVRVLPEDQFLEILRNEDSVFEGAQGVLLDQQFGFFPHCTRSFCTFRNADTLLTDAGFQGSVTRVGLLRAYATRHGAGPFVSEDSSLELPHCHNHHNDWQGEFRLGWFDALSARYALKVCGGVDQLSITNLDRMNGLKTVKVATRYHGSSNTELISEDRISTAAADLDTLRLRTEALCSVSPVYEVCPGWNAVSETTMEGYLERLSSVVDHPIQAISTSSDHHKIYR